MAKKVAIISGATAGIGLATVEKLAKKGVTVYAGIRSTSDLTELQKLQ